jgi:hypothetical protein
MTEQDLVDSLKAAIDRSDPSWTTQPSRLRRRLEEELGANARKHRAQVHQLVVAAEERIPLRLKRNGWSPEERAELGDVLVRTRGWTPAAADWTVATWAAALGLSTERPPVPVTNGAPPTTVVPEASSPVAAKSPMNLPVAPTLLPPAASATVLPHAPLPPAAPIDATVLPAAQAAATVLPGAARGDVPPTESAATGLPPPPPDRAPLPPPPARSPGSAPVATPLAAVPSDELPRTGMKQCTAKASAFLREDLDVAYDVKVGPTPALLLLIVPVGIAAPFAPLMLRGQLLIAFMVVITLGVMFWPKQILAVKGEQLWLLDNSIVGYKPTRVLAQGTRADLVYAGGWPYGSVRLGETRMWFQPPIGRAARRLPIAQSAEVGA